MNEAMNQSSSTTGALSVALVDDEAPARVRLRDLLSDAAAQMPNEVVVEAVDGHAAIDAITALADRTGQMVDLVLTDIRMPKMDGIELARHLSRLDAPPAVIFITAYDSYAVQAFELNAIDYLVKPVRLPRLVDALRKARQRRTGIPVQALVDIQQSARVHLSCHERGRLLLIPVAEILYLRADFKYVMARTVQRDYLIDESLTQLEAEFSERFIRLHRNALAAREAIVGFERGVKDDGESQWQALIRGVPEKLPVSRRQWPIVKACMKPCR